LVLYEGKEKDNEKDFDFSIGFGVERLWRVVAGHAYRSAASHCSSNRCDSFSSGGCNTASVSSADGYARSAYSDSASYRGYCDCWRSEYRSGSGSHDG
jgi:hypothetical protein